MRCTCAYSWGAQAIRPWAGQISQAQQERIKKSFPSAKPINGGGLALPPGTAASAGASAEREPAVIDLGAVAEYYTGYARIDNAVIDALKGRSQEVKDGVYDIIRHDLVPHNVHGLKEEDRLAQISLGVEKARYIAEQFMDERTRVSFMDAIRSIAKIGAAGERRGCEMEYPVKRAICFNGNGYVMEDPSDEFLFAMERLSPKDYETYKKMSEAGGESATEASFFALRWAMAHMDAVAGNRKAYGRHKDEQYGRLEQLKLDQTFSGVDVSGKEGFLASVRERLQANQKLQADYFLEQIQKMAEAPGGYLTARRWTLNARG